MIQRSFTYPGGKGHLSDWIISNMADHTLYVEPFCGSAAVLLNKNPSKQEVLNDIDGNITFFFETLRDRKSELIEYLNNTPYSYNIYKRIVQDYYSGHYPDDPIERAGQFYFLRYAQFGAKADAPAGFSRPSGQTSAPANKFKNSQKNLEYIASRLHYVHFDNLDYIEIIERYDDVTTLFYCDPPYKGTEKRYSNYEFNHDVFIDKMKNIDGKFILSYDHDMPDWDWTKCLKDSHNHIGQGGATTEYLYMNYDPNHERLFQGHEQTSIVDY